MSINYGEGTNPAELMLRVIRSCQNIEEFTKERIEDKSALYGFHTTFIEAEQSLLFGHLTHPTPKSRQGYWIEKCNVFSRIKRRMSASLFSHKSIVNEKSLLSDSTTMIIKKN